MKVEVLGGGAFDVSGGLQEADSAMERRGLNVRKVLLGVVLPLLRRLPPRTASHLIAGIGRTEYTLLRKLRYRMDEAVRRGSHHFGQTWDVPGVGKALCGNQIRWRTRDRLLDGLPDDRVAPLFEVRGREILDSALAEGRGVVLLCNHFGSHMMPAHWLMREGYALRLFMERPRHISRFLSSRFDTDGPTGQKKLFISRRSSPADSAGAILRAARVLGSGMVLMIAGDVRWTGAQTSPATFLGHPYSFSNTWVRLAAMTGAPVVPVFCRVLPDGSFRLGFEGPSRIPRGGLNPLETDALVRTYLERVEREVGDDPTNSNDYFFWADQAAETPA